MPSRLTLLSLLLACVCPCVWSCAGTSVGFGIAVSLRVDGRVSSEVVSAVETLRVSSAGDESGSFTVQLNRPLNPVESFIYRPAKATRIITLTVAALDSHGNVLLSGTSPTLALEPGKTTSTEIVLSAEVEATDFAGLDLTGVDLMGIDFASKPDLLAASDMPIKVDGGSVVEVAGEQVEVAAGWTVSLYLDISKDYTYVANDFSDPSTGDTDDNSPRRIVSLVAPFKDGLAVLAGRSIIEIPSQGAAVVHTYKPPMPNGTIYPDIPRDLYYAPAAGTDVARLLVSGNSSGLGDGVFAVGVSWAMTNVINSNNNSCVDFDATGVFQGKGTPETFFSAVTGGAPGTLVRNEDDIAIVTSPPVDDCEVLNGSTIALVIDESTDMADAEKLATVSYSGGTYKLNGLTSTGTPYGYSLTTGALTRLPSAAPNPTIYAVLSSPSSFLAVDSGTGATTTVAKSLTTGWAWVHSAVPPMDQLALGTKAQVVLLESNRNANLDRILLLTPP